MERNSAPSGPVAQFVKHDGKQDLAFVEEATTAPRLITAYPLRRDHV